MTVSKVFVSALLCLSCGSSPSETVAPAPSVATPVSAPAPPKEPGPECKKLFLGYDEVCSKHKDNELCQGDSLSPLRTSLSESACASTLKSNISVIKATTGEAPWGPVEGAVKLPQTFSPASLPKGFVSDGDGFEKVTEKLSSPFLGATSTVSFMLPGMKDLEGNPVGFQLFFFEYQFDRDLIQNLMERGGFQWAITKDNLLILLPRVMSTLETGEQLAKGIDGKTNNPPSSLPMRVKIGDMAKEYKENEIKAEAKYKGKRIIGGGKVDRVRRNMSGDAYLWFKSDKFSMFDASCLFPKEREKDLALLEEGMSAIIEGVVDSKSMIQVEILDCSLLAYGNPPKDF